MAASIEDSQIDDIVDRIITGDSYRKIAADLGVSLTTLHRFTSKQEHSARVKEALNYSASSFEEKAEDVLINAKGNLVEIQRARELAQHYRWKASKRNPFKYGDKLDITSDGEKIAAPVINVMPKE